MRGLSAVLEIPEPDNMAVLYGEDVRIIGRVPTTCRLQHHPQMSGDGHFVALGYELVLAELLDSNGVFVISDVPWLRR